MRVTSRGRHRRRTQLQYFTFCYLIVKTCGERCNCRLSLSCCLSLSVASEKPLEESSWSALQLAVLILGPCLLLCVGIVAAVFVVQSRRCAYTTHKQDPEEHLNDQMLMSTDKCLKDLIGDMSTSGSGSGRRRRCGGKSGPDRQLGSKL